MSGKARIPVESSSVNKQETSNTPASTVSEDVKTKSGKPKRKFVASLRSNIRHLGSSVGSSVGLKMNKQQKQGSLTDPTHSSELKKNKKQKSETELKSSSSADKQQNAGARPKAPKVGSNLVKKLSLDKIYQSSIGQQYAGPSTSPTPPLSSESDVKSTSSTEISVDSWTHVSTSKSKEHPVTGSETVESKTTKLLEDLILQTQQTAKRTDNQATLETGKIPQDEFIEAESKSNLNETVNPQNEKAKSTDSVPDIKAGFSKKDEDKPKVEDQDDQTRRVSFTESKNTKSTKVMTENIVDNVKETIEKETDNSDDSVQNKKTQQEKEQEWMDNVKSKASERKLKESLTNFEVDLKRNENRRRSDDVEKQLMTPHVDKIIQNVDDDDDKLKQKQFLDGEKESLIERKTKRNTDEEIKSQDVSRRKSFHDGVDDGTSHIEINKNNDGEKEIAEKEIAEKETENNEKLLQKKDKTLVDKNESSKHDSKTSRSAIETVDQTSGNIPEKQSENDEMPSNSSTDVSSTISPKKRLSTDGTSEDNSHSPEATPVAVRMTHVQDKRECLYKILVIGELGTGKTSIIKRYVHQFFSQHYRATIGVDFALKVLNWDPNTIIRLQLWDIAGQERFGNMTRVYYKEAVGAFIVFDVTRSATFDAVLKWKQDLDAKVQLADGASIPCVLLANKCDQPKEGIVNNNSKMEEFCKENNFSGWFETSAKENINIDEAAKNLVTQILQNDKLSQNGRESRDATKFPLDGKSDQEEKKSCYC